MTLFPGSGPEPSRRKVTIDLNPGGPTAPPGGDLLYVRSVGLNDSLHFLFCSQGAPSLLLVQSNSNESRLQVDWDRFTERNSSSSLKVEPQSSVVYSGALVFSRLWEYNDLNDTADPISDLFPPYDLQDFSWSRLNLSTLSAQLCGVYNRTNGSLCLQLSVFEDWGRSESWPRLLHGPDSTQLQFWLDGLSSRTTHSRFLLELRSVGGASLNRVNVIRSIDDEFTPSIFKVCQWLSNSSGPGFVQWKPVAYGKVVASLEVAMPLRHWSPRQQDSAETALSSGLVQGFYGNDSTTFGLNVTFGLSGDAFYGSTNFLSWTLLVGVGAPPLDSFSPLVMSILAVGLGTPLLLLALGGSWLCLRKWTSPSATAYEPIN